MITYSNVTMVCVKRENTVWGWRWVSAAQIKVPRKVREMSGREFYIARRVVTLNIKHLIMLRKV